MLWAGQIRQWMSLPNIEGVSVMIQSSDIVNDFLQVFDASRHIGDAYEKRNNASLSPLLIKLLLNFKEIRSVHAAEADSIFSKYLSFEGKVTWIIDSHLSETIINATRDDNLLLMKMLSADNKEKMKNDPRWWDKDYYSSRKIWKDEDFELTKNDMHELLKKTIPANIELGKKIDNWGLVNGMNFLLKVERHFNPFKYKFNRIEICIYMNIFTVYEYGLVRAFKNLKLKNI